MREIELALYDIDKKTMIELYLKLQEQLFKFNNLLVPLLKEAKRNARAKKIPLAVFNKILGEENE